MSDAAYWIDRLRLQPHPEGGYFRETYRAKDTIAAEAIGERFAGPRSTSTSIYFLLTDESFSSLHRMKSDEVWNFHAGSALTVHVIDPGGTYRSHRVGLDLDNGQEPQAVVTAGSWFGASVDEPGGFALVGCTVAPGFDFADFELADREVLIREFPQHEALIRRLTR
ncbi:cupin domain-containing protein [Tautonia rosea]|uniref:cupin domain-containing protein n=1 Tax=Tautonia rosea TaxID=2728037 RepID=UPI00147327F2|nr:cupin domain-containing protein [Tautonia rosea]